MWINRRMTYKNEIKRKQTSCNKISWSTKMEVTGKHLSLLKKADLNLDNTELMII